LKPLKGKNALITGAGVRLGRVFALAIAEAGANIAVHYGRSEAPANETVLMAEQSGVKAESVQANLAKAAEAGKLVEQSQRKIGELDILVNSAAIFEPHGALETDLEIWQKHIDVNLTAPFLISKAFARSRNGREGTIINILDWRALRPGADHFAYTIAKAGLAAMTQSLAQALAPSTRVNGLALGAILPASSGDSGDPLDGVPVERWGTTDEVAEALLFLLAGPGYITGEILHLDGGRHLT
jgi:pteridine reductase